jgi:hypothetical protein
MGLIALENLAPLRTSQLQLPFIQYVKLLLHQISHLFLEAKYSADRER